MYVYGAFCENDIMATVSLYMMWTWYYDRIFNVHVTFCENDITMLFQCKCSDLWEWSVLWEMFKMNIF